MSPPVIAPESPDTTGPAQPPPDQPSSAEPREPGSRTCGLVEAIAFLFPIGDRSDSTRAGAFSLAIPWIVPLGFVIGLVWTGLFKAAWRIYGETAGMRVIPALTIVLMECLLTGPFLALGLARTIDLLAGTRPLRPESTSNSAPLSPVGTLTLCLTVLCEWVLIVSVPAISPWWPSIDDWRHHFSFLYPAPVYRPLLLAPLWGRWAILLAATVGRTARHADAETMAFCSAMSPGRLLRHAILPLAVTSIYLSRDGNLLIGVVVGLLVFALTYLICVAMARRGGGQTRQTLFAAAQFAQLVFLALYRAFWPLIHA